MRKVTILFLLIPVTFTDSSGQYLDLFPLNNKGIEGPCSGGCQLNDFEGASWMIANDDATIYSFPEAGQYAKTLNNKLEYLNQSFSSLSILSDSMIEFIIPIEGQRDEFDFSNAISNQYAATLEQKHWKDQSPMTMQNMQSNGPINFPGTPMQCR